MKALAESTSTSSTSMMIDAVALAPSLHSSRTIYVYTAFFPCQCTVLDPLHSLFFFVVFFFNIVAEQRNYHTDLG